LKLAKIERLLLFLVTGKYLFTFQKMKSQGCISVYAKIQHVPPASVVQRPCLSSIFTAWSENKGIISWV